MYIKEETKLEIIKRLEGGDTIKDLVNEYEISKTTIYQLKKDNEPKSIDNFNMSAREIYLLRKEVEALRQTIKI